ncbi:MAG TPA: class I SAM-dependent methyltransferase [Pseudomonadales bacterium]
MARAVCPVCEGISIRPFTTVEGRFYDACNHCEAVWLEPSQHLSPAEEVAHYQLHENDVADVGYRQFLSKLAGPLLSKLMPAQHGLDYGCGPGPALAALLEEAGHHVTVYDPVFACNATALQRQYDFITCTEVAEHFHDAASEFARFDTLLKPGGWLGVMTGMLPDDVDFSVWHYRRDPTHVVFYRPQTFECLAKRYAWVCEFPVKDVVLIKKPA